MENKELVTTMEMLYKDMGIVFRELIEKIKPFLEKIREILINLEWEKKKEYKKYRPKVKFIIFDRRKRIHNIRNCC